MEHQRFAGRTHGVVALDLCWGCHAIWFDQYESAQLSPAAVIALFRLIHEHRSHSAKTLADVMGCPRCPASLALTHDMQRTNRLRYHRCPAGHGRLTTFIQFLREKEFVRSLSAPEIEALRATVSQVACSSCGAIIDVARDAACGYCRAPLAILDAAAVEKALSDLSDAEHRRTAPAPANMAAAFESLLAASRSSQPEPNVWLRETTTMSASRDVIDLVVAGIGLLLRR